MTSRGTDPPPTTTAPKVAAVTPPVVAHPRSSGATGASRPRPARVSRIIPPAARNSRTAQVDASSDAALVIAAGAPSDAQVRREIRQLQKAGLVLPNGDTAASFATSPLDATVTAAQAEAAGAGIPLTAWNPLRKPIADWIIPVLQWAHDRGWAGTVTSGYRSYAEQAALNAAGLFSAPAGASNHETTAYPGGAVDVTGPAQLIQVLANYTGPELLVGGVLGPVDPEHFSATGD
jgi:hypothetical protein